DDPLAAQGCGPTGLNGLQARLAALRASNRKVCSGSVSRLSDGRIWVAATRSRRGGRSRRAVSGPTGVQGGSGAGACRHSGDAGAEFAAVAVLLPEVQLRHLAPGELKHELVGAGLEEPGEVGRVRALEARAAETVAEADMVGEARAHPLGGGVEEPRHLLARDGASRGLVDLDEVGAGGDEPAELRVDDLG